MKCQIVQITGSSCRAASEYLVVPQDSTVEAMLEKKLFLCQKHAKAVAKDSPGSLTRKVSDIQAGQALYASMEQEQETLSVVDPFAEADALVMDDAPLEWLTVDELVQRQAAQNISMQSVPDHNKEVDLEDVERRGLDAIEEALQTHCDEQPRTLIYTTAPEDYDGFGARTEAVVGETGTNGSTKTYRLVSIPEEHVSWFRNRCGSGLHNNHTETEWREMLGQEFFTKKFRPAPGYVLPEPLPFDSRPPKRSIPHNTSTTLAPAVTQALEAQTYKAQSKAAQATSKQTAKAAMETARAEQKVQRETEKQTQHEVQASSTVNPLAAKVQYLLALVTEGEDAMTEALRKGRVAVRLARQPGHPRRPGSSSGLVRKLTLDTARVIRQRLAAGDSAQALMAEYGVSSSLIGNIRRNKIWKEPAA